MTLEARCEGYRDAPLFDQWLISTVEAHLDLCCVFPGDPDDFGNYSVCRFAVRRYDNNDFILFDDHCETAVLLPEYHLLDPEFNPV